jgi:hypothetical protein
LILFIREVCVENHIEDVEVALDNIVFKSLMVIISDGDARGERTYRKAKRQIPSA